uniref:Cyclic phosphodiesterase-like protein n=1 Tax=Phytophthora ramorum TaxID=164328 RepID=H3GM08_PHYRM
MADSADLVAGFSVWAVPGQSAAQELGDVIKTYAGRLQTLPFLPHMTVLSGVKLDKRLLKGLSVAEVTTKLSELADSMRALDVEIQTVTFKIYAVERNDEFMPHVSFLIARDDTQYRHDGSSPRAQVLCTRGHSDRCFRSGNNAHSLIHDAAGNQQLSHSRGPLVRDLPTALPPVVASAVGRSHAV